MIKTKNIFFLSIFFYVANINAQKIDVNAFYGGFQFHSAGMGFSFKTGKYISEKNLLFADIDLVSIKHQKEIKVYNPSLEQSGRFIFGKINKILNTRIGVGLKHQFGKRKSRDALGISALASAGLNLAWKKPVYIEYFQNTDVYINKRYEPQKDSLHLIGGYSKFSEGLNQTSILPGLYAKLGLLVEWGNYSSDTKAIEIGFVLDAFSKKLPILYTNNNKQVFYGLYVTFALGKFY